MSFLRGILFAVLVVAALLFGAFALLEPVKERLVAANSSMASLAVEIQQLQERAVFLNMQVATESDQDVGAYQFSATDLLDAEVMLQSRVLNALALFDIAPVSFAPTLPTVETTKQVVGFEVEFETGFADAFEVLANLEMQTPILAIEDLWIRNVPASSRPEEVSPVYVRLVIWSFWTSGTEEEG